MSARYTKGPWRLSDDRCQVIAPEAVSRYGARPVEVLDLTSAMGGDDPQADAALIAASPELLEVLVMAVEASGHSLSGPTDPRAAENGEPAWVCRAREVIAGALAG